jgi:protein gp37
MQAPQHWKSPKRVFAGDMTDLFHPSVQDDWLESMFTVVRAARQHAFHILTKRPERLVEFAARSEACLSGLPGNVLFGVTVTSLDELWKLDVLLELSGAAGFFVSLEPLLGPVDLAPYFPRVICSACGGKGCPDCYRIAGLSWVVLGFETGDGARPYDPQWALDVRDACTRASVPFFFKSWGERKPVEAAGDGGPYRRRGDGSPILIRVGTHRSGRLLDGREHNDMPEVR